MRPPISVVIATTQPWPEVAGCLAALRDQVERVGAEVIVADGDGAGLPATAGTDLPFVRCLLHPGASVFELRGFAIAAARADVVAVTEDHCRPGQRWLDGILAAHREFPEAAAIGGIVENGATSGVLDWANFLLIFAPVVGPITRGPQRHISLQANVSYKRRALPPPRPDRGVMEMLLNQSLYERGQQLVADDRLVVYHVQSHGWRGTLAAHFHNGRSIAGYRLPALSAAGRLARVASCPLLPPHLVLRVVRAVIAKGRLRGVTLVCLPVLGVLATCHAAGELVGYLAGPGRSPHQLR